MADQFTFYGFPDECHKFEARHPAWNEIMGNLVKAMDLAFTRVDTMEGAADKLVYFFGRIVLEDFMEITLVCYHGYGVAASKLVRSMYEYAITLRYLHKHPTEADAFLAYHLVQQEKLINRLIETFGENILPSETIAEARSKASEAKGDFMVPVCDHPGAKMRLNHTWNKLDFVAMAKKTGALGKLIIPGYYMPLRHAHPTFGGLEERLEVVDGHMHLKAEAQTEIVDRSLMTAHNRMLDALQVQYEHFQIAEMQDVMQICFQDFLRVWSPESPVLKA